MLSAASISAATVRRSFPADPQASSQAADASSFAERAHARDAHQPARPQHGNIGARIASATPGTLLASLRNTALPRSLHPTHAAEIRNLLDRHHPRTLVESPLIDARGRPIPLRLAPKPLTDCVSGDVIPVASWVEKGVLRMFTGYRQHLKWEQDNLAVRTIRPGEAEPPLVGQEGVFAKKDIPTGTPVMFFSGMHLTDPKDIEADARIRDLSGVGSAKYRVEREGGIIQGMGIAMKLNSSQDDDANLFPLHVNVVKGNGETVKMMALVAKKPIPAGQELRYNYGHQPAARTPAAKS